MPFEEKYKDGRTTTPFRFSAQGICLRVQPRPRPFKSEYTAIMPFTMFEYSKNANSGRNSVVNVPREKERRQSNYFFICKSAASTVGAVTRRAINLPERGRIMLAPSQLSTRIKTF
ncbi:hypothetical protein EVAR_75640_1 [Eumeta japonica]|uniref:Uncharacterized protein n=1 Tax=Eumeta variegata TaxID=151549 RepID=A0A4C1U0E7_EUMVA|nr:hypothetical protein EVAR_75640_1 [Eumeta japonica]